MSPMFDASTFMQQTVDGPLETEYTLVPEGEYLMTIDDFDEKAFEKIEFEYKKGDKAGTPGTMTKFNVPFVVQDDKVKQELARDKVVVTKQIILDLDDAGGLSKDKNKNIELGRIRQAAGQNDSGPWSPANLRGAGPMMGKIVHREFERKDGTKGKRAEIDRVVRIS